VQDSFYCHNYLFPDEKSYDNSHKRQMVCWASLGSIDNSFKICIRFDDLDC